MWLLVLLVVVGCSVGCSEALDDYLPHGPAAYNTQQQQPQHPPTTWLKYLLARNSAAAAASAAGGGGGAVYADDNQPGPAYGGPVYQQDEDEGAEYQQTQPLGPVHGNKRQPEFVLNAKRAAFTDYFKYKRNNGIWIWMPAQGYVSVPKDQQTLDSEQAEKQAKIMRYGK